MSVTRIKICGMRRKEDIEAANACRPDYIGFILSPGFRRSVTPEEAEQLARGLAPAIMKVGVFVNESAERIAAASGFLDLIQLHGNEDNTFIRALRERTEKPVIQAFRLKQAEDLRKAMESEADLLLFDNGTGSGEVFDWSLLSGAEKTGGDASVPPGQNSARPWILAGGLGPDNVAEAVRKFRPYAVDLSSGAETDGWKDPEKMAKCVQAVRSACGDKYFEREGR